MYEAIIIIEALIIFALIRRPKQTQHAVGKRVTQNSDGLYDNHTIGFLREERE